MSYRTFLPIALLAGAAYLPNALAQPVPIWKSVFGQDDRTVIPNTEIFPWHTIAYMSLTRPDGSGGRCTGVVVTPYVVLTNAHCLYVENQADFITRMRVRPGLYEEGGNARQPFPYQDAVGWEVHPDYLRQIEEDPNASTVTVDLGAVFLAQPFDHISAYMPIAFNATPNLVEVVGYSREVQSSAESFDLWSATGPVTDTRTDVFLYQADVSSGGSGAPLLIETNGERHIVGLHAVSPSPGSIDANGGPRFGGLNRFLLLEWLRWRPTGEDNSDSDGDSVPDDLEPLLGLNPAWPDNDLFNDAELFVRQLYRDILGREGEAEGIAYWTQELAEGRQSRATLGLAFVLSGEFFASVVPRYPSYSTSELRVQALYEAMLQRFPEQGGFLYWVDRLDNLGEAGVPELVQSFLDAPEYRDRFLSP